jgi:hypothetical protein
MAKKDSTSKQMDWPAALRTGPEFVKKWNRLTRAERKKVDLSGLEFQGCDLTEINLENARALRTSFASAALVGANLGGASFDEADFAAARLNNCDLGGARLRGTSFLGADLTGADLRETNVQGADFTQAILQEAKLDSARFDPNTKWPAGFSIPGEVIWAGRGTDPRLSGKGRQAVAADINGLMARLHKLIDPNRVKRTLDMLKSGKNQIFSEVEPTLVRGIVRSQKEEHLVYSCVLTDDGTYACCTPDVAQCLGLRGEPCKHILVLIIGLTRAGLLDPTTIDRWLVAACGKNHRWNKTTKNHVSDTLLKYKGVQAGEIDWRPTETIPEDYYAM